MVEGEADMNDGRDHVMLPIVLVVVPVKLHVVVVQEPAPAAKVKVNAPVVLLMEATPTA
jgi:hypothetical protein